MSKNALLNIGLFWLLQVSVWGQGVIGPQLPKQEKLTLGECLNRALQNNPNIRIARHKIEESQGLIIAARATLYPTLSADGRVEERNPDMFKQDLSPYNDKFADYWTLQVRVSRSLYSGGANREKIAIANLQNETSFISLQETMEKTVQQVKTAFYTVLLRQNQLETQRKNIGLLQAERDRQKNLFEAGRSTRFNVLRIEVQLANEQPELLRIQTSLISAQTDLANLLNITWPPGTGGAPFDLVGTLDCPPVDANVESLISLARARRPELRRLEKEITINEKQLLVERASNRPQLDAFVGANLNQDESKSQFFANKTDFSLGVLGKWNIFDGFASRGKGKILDSQIAQSRIGRDAFYLTVDSEVRKAFYTLQEAKQTIASQSANVKRAQESLELARLSAETGYGTVLDVLQATIDLTRSRNLENEARHRYLSSTAALEQAVSMKVEDWGGGSSLIPAADAPSLMRLPESEIKSAGEPPMVGPPRPPDRKPGA
jgi:outer membrane protein TolC